ncbi:mitogen-activated protein kinase HOG1A-like [Melanotaenia boesemani]|uniref:mitogen-activated protein kinase HOG1A-like n=1 Tax=Melanotaenia boesemani TaxID=1250792 RepID=UPI001C05E181|nr:mitogen-activated protein kinase HOG1A-like [Melanotaenia boesemani]
MENYVEDGIIGMGSYGVVYKVRSVKDGKEYALKCHMYPVLDATVRELSSLAALRGHQFVIQMFDCFITDGKITTLMPLMPYTLHMAIYNHPVLAIPYGLEGGMPLSFVARFSVQVATALSYMHRLNLVHRDINPSNVLLTEDLTVKVSDMGLARQVSKWMSPEVCTELYRAPELFAEIVGDGQRLEYTCAIDMWSLGTMIADAVEGTMVFGARECGADWLDTCDIIIKTLCPRNHPSASQEPWDPALVMPNVTKHALVKRITFGLLAFNGNERLLAHELLLDKEWSEATHMTEKEIDSVRAHILLGVQKQTLQAIE